MCEHNLVIGEDYKLFSGVMICSGCSHKWNPQDIPATYLGDFIINYHRFRPISKVACPKCGYGGESIDFACGGGSPIDVTQEFLSLSVGSRE